MYYDIAAVMTMSVSLLSLVLRRATRSATNRMYLVLVILTSATALFNLGGELYDEFLEPFLVQNKLIDPAYPHAVRSALMMLYYAFRSLTAPFYLLFIAIVTDTTHRLFRNTAVRVIFFVPMVALLVFIVTNPFHHLMYSYDGLPHRGPFIFTIYLSAAYYAALGIGYLVRWRSLLTRDKFVTLFALYPLNAIAVAIQFVDRHMRVEMFMTSLAMLLLTSIVIRPDSEIDRLAETSGIHAYNEMLRRAFATEKPLCLVYIDMVNRDRLLELGGKEALHGSVLGLSRSLSETLEQSDTLYYLRNGMFCISATNTNEDHALAIARTTHESARQRDLAKGEGEHVSSSIQMRTCVVNVPADIPDYQTLQTFTSRLSHLMPESGVTTYRELSQQKDFNLLMALADIVARGISERAFEVHYQPIYCVSEGRYRTAEALVRLKDPSFGYVSPALFIPEAERSGAVLDIGQIIFDKTCGFLGQDSVKETGLHYVEVNLSVEQCVQPTMADDLLEAMRRHRVDPSFINMEITETSATYSQEIIEANVRRLAAEGIAFSVDDYGSGYSSLARTLTLPFSLVKIDKSLVDALGQPTVHSVLADTVASMKRIGKEVLVEGVETQEQADELIAMGVDYIQGYLYARPMPEDEFVAFLKERNSR